MLFQVLDILYFLATPFVNLGLGVLHLALWPLRLLARFEVCPFYTEPINLYTIDIDHFLKDLLIYLALAILTGVISGLILHCTCTFFVDYLPGCFQGLLPTTPSLLRNRTEEEYPQSEDEPGHRKPLAVFHRNPTPPSDYYARWGSGKDAGPLSSTILEEEEFSE